ncbi:hypothetical protein TNCV_577861 [Trichonephila clavipes]|nr:hypothetical protein TNCV_577861 [Trichonephila clavipes]
MVSGPVGGQFKSLYPKSCSQGLLGRLVMNNSCRDGTRSTQAIANDINGKHSKITQIATYVYELQCNGRRKNNLLYVFAQKSYQQKKDYPLGRCDPFSCKSQAARAGIKGLSDCLELKFVFVPVVYSYSDCQVIYSQFGLAIHQNDHQARRRFVEWSQKEIAVVPDFHKRILFSDEAHFWLNGYVNKQNCHIWSEANPQVYVETPLHPEKLTVWCAFMGWWNHWSVLLQKR